MAQKEPRLTVGIEEEYLLVNRETRQLESEPPAAVLEECEARIKDRIKPEFLKSQIEVATRVCDTVDEARQELIWLRGTVNEICGQYGLGPIAASTHPFSEWQEQTHTDKDRYNVLAEDMQSIARRLVICGMHVHVGIEDDELRIDLMNQISYFLPHLLALSTSSPFWRGEDTGLKSFRLSIFNELPRTGLPQSFETFSEYQRHVDVLVNAGLIEDASMIWWDLRPSARYPTLELRITDVCPRVEDAAAIAALFTCIVRMLYRLRIRNQRWRRYAPMLIAENRWRAQRYGTDGTMVDFGKSVTVPFAELIEELLGMVAEDAEALGCVAELNHCRTIAREGTSASRQLQTYKDALAGGADNREALNAVVDQLLEETLASN